MTVIRRGVMTAAAAGALIAAAAPIHAADRAPVKIGDVVSKTGVNAAGAGTAAKPHYELRARDVAEAGGFMPPDGARLPVEITAYDGRSETQEAIRGIERLARQDEVDFILPPRGAGFNLAVAPLMARFGCPQPAGASVVPRAGDFAKRWPASFRRLGSTGEYAEAPAGLLQAQGGALNGKVAMLSIADGFGIEFSTAAREALHAAGIALVLDRTHPLGAQDFATLLAEAQASGADVLLA